MQIDERTARAFSNKHLNLIIMPTESCNFRCTYCYETFALKRMPLDIVEGICNLISRRSAGLEGLTISWFGGEPLLGMKAIDRISSVAIRGAKDHGHAFSASITTNGYLLDGEVMERCISAQIKTFHIALDGPAEEHDKTRVMASGRPTFDRIWNNITGALSLKGDFEFLLRLHYNSENYRAVMSLASEVGKMSRDDGRVKLYFKPIAPYGGACSTKIKAIPVSLRHEIEKELHAACGNAQSAPSKIQPICYASMANSILIRANGKIGKCTVALDEEFNNIGQIDKSGVLAIDQDRFRPWISPLINGNAQGARCPLQTIASQIAV